MFLTSILANVIVATTVAAAAAAAADAAATLPLRRHAAPVVHDGDAAHGRG
jgi:hypothetical protein